MAYKHGAYGVTGETQAEVPVQADTVLVAFGTSKTGTKATFKTVSSLAEYKAAFGWDDDYGTSTLEAVAEAAFAGPEPIGSVVFATCGQSVGTDSADLIEVIGQIGRVYTELHQVPSILLCPVHAKTAAVHTALMAALKNIAGIWPDAKLWWNFEAAGHVSVDDIADDKDALTCTENERTFCGIMQEKAARGEPAAHHNPIELATLAAVKQYAVDAANGDWREDVSNLLVGWNYDSFSTAFDRTDGNELNEHGVTCAIWLEGLRFWGPHTAKYAYGASGADAKDTFSTTVRALQYVETLFIKQNAGRIDRPFTRQMRDTILVQTRQWLDRMKATGALLFGDVEFVAADNSAADMLEGRFTFRLQCTPTVPMVSATLVVSYTDAGLSVLVEE